MAITDEPPREETAPGEETAPPTERLGGEGEGCTSCRASLAPDQRYCLNCGLRRAEARVPFMEILRPPSKETVERETVPRRRGAFTEGSPTNIGIAVGVVVLLLGFGTVLGGLIAKLDDSGPVAVAGGPAGPAQSALASNGPAGGTGAFKDDWPKDKEGYTVQLQALQKEGTNPAGIADAKKKLSDDGVKEVGGLDSDNYKSLDPGNYVVYSGVFDSKGDADKRLDEVGDKADGAKVIRVSSKKAAGSGVGAGADERASSGEGGGGKDAAAADIDAINSAKKTSTADLTKNKEKAVIGQDQLDDIENISRDPKKAAKLPKEISIQGKPLPKAKPKTGGTVIGG